MRKAIFIVLSAIALGAFCGLSLYDLRSSDSVPVAPRTPVTDGCTGSASVIFNGADTVILPCDEEEAGK